jgi:hypothetical protein
MSKNFVRFAHKISPAAEVYAFQQVFAGKPLCGFSASLCPAFINTLLIYHQTLSIKADFLFSRL